MLAAAAATRPAPLRWPLPQKNRSRTIRTPPPRNRQLPEQRQNPHHPSGHGRRRPQRPRPRPRDQRSHSRPHPARRPLTPPTDLPLACHPSAFAVIPRLLLVISRSPLNGVISTGAMDSLIVHCVVERPPHFAFAFVADVPALFPQKYFKKVAFFPPPKNSHQTTTPHQQSTTTSPQKTITKTPVFSKTP